MVENDKSSTGATEPPPESATKKIITKAQTQVLYDRSVSVGWQSIHLGCVLACLPTVCSRRRRGALLVNAEAILWKKEHEYHYGLV
jgi:hypothetical protein